MLPGFPSIRPPAARSDSYSPGPPRGPALRPLLATVGAFAAVLLTVAAGLPRANGAPSGNVRIPGSVNVPVWQAWLPVVDHAPSVMSGGFGRAATRRQPPNRSPEVLLAGSPVPDPVARWSEGRKSPEPEVPLVAVAYRVLPGDTVAGLAKQFRVNVDSVLANNPVIADPDVLLIGTDLQIPADNGFLYTVEPGDTVVGIAASFGASPQRIRKYAANGMVRGARLVAGQQILVPVSRPRVAIPEPAADEPSVVSTPTDAPVEEPTPTPAPEPPSSLPVGPGHTTGGVNLRLGPGTDYAVIVVLPANSDLFIGEASGQFYAVTYGSYNGWAAADYLDSGPSPAPPAVAIPESPPVSSSPGWDDYPYGSGDGSDPLGFALANCTSFAAWRINSVLGIPFDAYAFGGYWGDAGYWEAAAATAGFWVDDVPSPGAIAQWRQEETLGGFGHVAYVMSVNADGSANIEEYNALVPLGYSQRAVFAPRYIHFVP